MSPRSISARRYRDKMLAPLNLTDEDAAAIRQLLHQKDITDD
jgi:hypothetical protein